MKKSSTIDELNTRRNDLISHYYNSVTFSTITKNRTKRCLEQDLKSLSKQANALTFSFVPKSKRDNKKVKVYNTKLEECCSSLGDVMIENFGKLTDFKQRYINEYFWGGRVYRCQICGQILEQSGKDKFKDKLKITADLEHILPKSIYPQFALSHENLIPCCLECNLREKGTRFMDFSSFNIAMKSLRINLSKRPLELYKKIKYSYDKNFELKCNFENNQEVMEFIKLYGLDVRYKKIFGQLYDTLFSKIKLARISSAEGLERFLENQLEFAYAEYNERYSLTNNPNLWQDFLNEILYDRCKLEALWEEVKDYNSQLLLY